MEAQIRGHSHEDGEKQADSKYILKASSIGFFEALCGECVGKHRLKDGFRSLGLG